MVLNPGALRTPLPFSVSEFRPRKFNVPASVYAFPSAKAPVEARFVVLASVASVPIVSTPVPTGPEVTVAPTALPTLLPPMTSPPACTLTPPENVLEPALSPRSPLPVFVIP